MHFLYKVASYEVYNRNYRQQEQTIDTIRNDRLRQDSVLREAERNRDRVNHER